jgi:hypothetical protein
LANVDACLLTNRGYNGRFQVSGLRRGNEVANRNFMDVEDLEVYKKLNMLPDT